MAGNEDVKIIYVDNGITYEDVAAMNAVCERTDNAEYRVGIQEYIRRICNLLRNQLNLPKTKLLLPVHRRVQ
jgi:hypothetical protein